MRRVDLLRGDRPWRVALESRPRPLSGLVSAATVLGGVIGALLSVAVSPALLAVVVALAVWYWRPQLWLVGGGRSPMPTTEWMEWNAHLALAHAEREHAEREAEAKSRARR